MLKKENSALNRLPFILVILGPLILLGPVYLRGQAIFWGTPLLQFAPWWSFAWKTLASGHLPLWNPLVGMGAPLLANYQSGLLYPPYWIHMASWMIGGDRLMAWGMALVAGLHLIWAGLGIVLLTHRLKLGTCAQIVSSLAFGLSGYLVARLGFLSINSAVAWLPWVLFSLTPDQNDRLAFNRRRFQWLVFALSMLLLSGHAQTAWYIIVLSVLWFAFWSLQPRFRSTNLRSRSRYCNLRDTWGYFGLALVFAAGICAIQLLPTAEYLAQSQRAEAVDYDFAMNYSFWPWHLLNLITPGLFGSPAGGDFWGFGNYWEDAVYVGLLPLLLAISAIIRSIRKKNDKSQDIKMTWFLVGILSISILLSLGANTPLYPWLYRSIPTFDMFQAPTRWMIWGVFALAMLAGLGADKWRRPQGWGLYFLRLATMGALAVSAGAGLLSLTSAAVSPTFIRSFAILGLLGVGAGLLALNAPPSVESAVEPIDISSDYDRVRSRQNRKISPLFLQLKPPPTQRSKHHFRRLYWESAVGIFLAADLLAAGWGLNPGQPLELYGPSPTAEKLTALAGSSRIYISPRDEDYLKYDRFLQFETFDPSENWLDLRAVMLPNTNILDGIPVVSNFDPFVPGRTKIWSDILSQSPAQAREKMLRLMDVGVIILPDQSSPHGVSFVEKEGERLRFVNCAIPVQGDLQAFRMLVSPQLDFEKVVVIEDSLTVLAEKCTSSSETKLPIQVTIQDESDRANPNRNDYHITTFQTGWFVISDVWYPGWRAYVDGKSVPLWRANFLFRAIRIPEGSHWVTIAYQPSSFYSGLGISLISLVILGVITRKLSV